MTKTGGTGRTEKILDAAFCAYIKNTSDIMFVKDINLIYLTSSQPFARMAGKQSASEIIGKSDFEIFEDQELAKRYIEDDKQLLRSDEDMLNYIEPLADEQGHARYCTTSKYILRDENGSAIGILGFSRDITKEYMIRQRYQQELRYLFELPADTYAALFLDIDDWRIIRHHRRTVGNHVMGACENMKIFAENAVNCLADPNDSETRAFYQNLTKKTMLALCDEGKRHYSLEYLRSFAENETAWVRTDINFLIDPENSHLCAIWSMKNIDNEKLEQMTLVHAAEYDEMTGIFNRAYTMRNIEEILERRSCERHALFAIDVDNFKALNDSFGHQAGDQFLISLARCLKTCFQDRDIIGRMGGDEFFVLMKNISSELSVTEKAETLLRMSRDICIPYAEQNISLSVGIAIFPENGTDLEQLYASADKALYKAKNEGKDQFLFALQERVAEE